MNVDKFIRRPVMRLTGGPTKNYGDHHYLEASQAQRYQKWTRKT